MCAKFDRTQRYRPILALSEYRMTLFQNHSAPLRFDLNRGRISNRDGDAFVLVPLAVMSELCRELSEDSLTSFGYAMGTEIGRRLSQRASSPGDLPTASLNDVVAALGDELATAGLGTLGVEIWGSALVFTLYDAVLSFGSGSGFVDCRAVVGRVDARV
jgi:hypothetical protein